MSFCGMTPEFCGSESAFDFLITCKPNADSEPQASSVIPCHDTAGAFGDTIKLRVLAKKSITRLTYKTVFYCRVPVDSEAKYYATRPKHLPDIAMNGNFVQASRAHRSDSIRGRNLTEVTTT